MSIFKIPLLFFLLGFGLSTPTKAQDIFDDISKSVSSGNSAKIATYFGNRVELKIGTKSDVYSHNQAEMVLRVFFDKNKVQGFTVVHRGSSNKGARYAIGNLNTTKGMFRVYFYVKEVETKVLIEEITFEPQ